jgi:MFS family permease
MTREPSVTRPTAKQRYFAGLSRETFLLAFASLFADISTEMLYPVLPVFLTQTLNATGSIVGLVDGAAQATQNIVQGFSGALSDKLQKRKSIALAGYLLAAIAKPLTGLATAWQGVLGARLLDRFGAGARSAPRDALIASSVDEQDRGRAFGLEGVGDNAGAFLGPLLAVFLLYAMHIGMRGIFYLAVIPGLLAFLMVLLVKGATVRHRGQIKDKCQSPAVSAKLLDISAGHRALRDRQFQQCVSDPADARHWRLSGADDPDLCGLQFGCRPDLLSRRVSLRPMGTQTVAA